MYMTSPLSWLSPLTFAKAAPACVLLFVFASSCASADRAATDSKHSSSATKGVVQPQAPSSEYEWAVQNYEAGKYDEAVKEFRRIATRGPETPAFDRIPFYLGMSLYRLGQHPEAERQLKLFLKGANSNNQEARLALLSVYERTQQWDRAVALAAETDQLTLFQDNRALVKLIWAQALKEKGERGGARAVLKEAAPYLDTQAASRGGDPDRDLSGRFQYTTQTLDQQDCATLRPKELPGSGRQKRRLYSAWLDAATDCLRKSVRDSRAELFSRESPWATATTNALEAAVASFGSTIQMYLKQEHGRLEERRKLQVAARQGLYRLLSEVDAALTQLKSEGFQGPSYENLRKRIDLLLVSLS